MFFSIKYIQLPIDITSSVCHCFYFFNFLQLYLDRIFTQKFNLRQSYYKPSKQMLVVCSIFKSIKIFSSHHWNHHWNHSLQVYCYYFLYQKSKQSFSIFEFTCTMNETYNTITRCPPKTSIIKYTLYLVIFYHFLQIIFKDYIK